ncbi:biosynthetic peptidoglycan transglycosylase [Paracoccus sp. (in: a-proteobacteria)]|uniref:biosynthetic peptidoglycan transglycosylase n=1 Tax=Paracoccus sp. TaxID=267 RepID=UPI00272A638A|nr:biosynthetic peptidoglycan transglycosylase [Paracoccus sp. (in: a-proteobacteria)]
MGQRQLRNGLSLRKFLIGMNEDLDVLTSWVRQHGLADWHSSIDATYIQSKDRPPVVTDILILEDRKFFSHRGFEVRAIARGAKRRFVYGKFGGISTIDQLLVRTCFKRSERTISRKGREIILAYILNMHQSKGEILAAFVNSAYFGPRLNGVDTAAEVIFGCRACDLSDNKSALIASLLPYPLPANIFLDLRRKGPAPSSEEILLKYDLSNPWWVSRIKMRMSYVTQLRAKYSEVV